MRHLMAALAALAAIVTGSSSHAALLGLSSSNPGVLYDINPATGAATVRVTTSVEVSSTGLEFLGGTLYATDIFINNVGTFGSINTGTGAFTPINNQGGSINWPGLAGSEAAGLLYTIDQDDNNILKSITPGGIITSIGSGTGIVSRGMAYDEDTNTLYATGDVAFPGVQSLFTIDTTTGTATLIGSTGVASFALGLAFDQVNDLLYMIADPDGFGPISGNLYTLNESTGAATLVGPTGVSDVIDGLAWLQPSQAASEPTTLALFGIALVTLGFSRRRRAA